MSIAQTLRELITGQTHTALVRRVELQRYSRPEAQAEVEKVLNSWSPTASRTDGKFVIERFETINHCGAVVYGVTVTRME